MRADACYQCANVMWLDLAEFERNLITERSKAGLSAARARGRKGGRPTINSASRKVAMAKKLYRDKTNTIREICKLLNISRATLYRYIQTGAEKA